MWNFQHEIAVAGHICVDIIPEMSNTGIKSNDYFVPGRLVEVGPTLIASGGVVFNTGLALHRLGANVKLMGKIGDDTFGKAILELLKQHGANLPKYMMVVPGEHSSYSVVLSAPNSDRMLFHFPGTNDTFGAEDINYETLEGVKLFHFGYPPLMRSMYKDGGEMLQNIFKRVRERGIVTSLDMAMPDPHRESGRADWMGILQRVLPFTDIFIPSVEELMFMTRRSLLESMIDKYGSNNVLANIDGDLLSSMSEELLEMGASIVGIKLGEHGLYIRSSPEAARIQWVERFHSTHANKWVNRELLSPCFRVDVRGTTGAGDCTIAGFIAGIVNGHTPEEVIKLAIGAGACSVEQIDAAQGMILWVELKERIANGWEHRSQRLTLAGWHQHKESHLWYGKEER